MSLGETLATATATPGDVLAYRQMWDAFVMGTIRGVSTVAQSMHNVAENPPDGVDPATLHQLGDAEQQWADAVLAEWNQFAGLSDEDILFQSHVILPAYWHTVQKCFDKQNDEKNPPAGQVSLSTGITWPDVPDFNAQQDLIAHLEGLGLVTKGAVQLVGDSAQRGAGLALGAVGGALGALPWQVWAGVAVAGVSVLMLGAVALRRAA